MSAREIVAKIRRDAAAADDASFIRAFNVIPERIEEVVDALERELNIAAQHAVLQAEEIASLKDKVTAAWTAGRELRELIARKAWGQRDTAYARGWTAGRDAAGQFCEQVAEELDARTSGGSDIARLMIEDAICAARGFADGIKALPPPESAP